MIQDFDLLIFSKAPQDYGPTRIKEEAEQLRLKVAIISYPRLDFAITKAQVDCRWEGRDLPKAKLVVFRAAGGDGYYIPQRDYLADLFSKQGARVLNFETYKKWSRLDKIAQHFEFQKGGLPFIDSLNFGSNRRLLEWAHDRKDPYIVKHNLSSQGRDVFKVEQVSQLVSLQASYRARTLLVQKFLKAGEDLRVIVLGGRAIGAMKRIAQEGHYLTNYSVGGKVEKYDLDADPIAREITEKTAAHFSLEYGGIDLMKDEEGNWKLLEVNRACQFEGFEASTGINVAKTLVEYLQQKSRLSTG